MDLRKAFFALALLLITTQVHSADRPAWDVPRLDSILVDGRIAEWADRGFRVGLIENRYGGFPDSADFGADVKLGWDDRGLLVSANVRDDVAFEARGDDAIGSFDTMTLYATPDRSSLELFEVTIAPGIDPEAGGPRVQVKGLDSAGRPKEAYAPRLEGRSVPQRLCAGGPAPLDRLRNAAGGHLGNGLPVQVHGRGRCGRSGHPDVAPPRLPVHGRSRPPSDQACEGENQGYAGRGTW